MRTTHQVQPMLGNAIATVKISNKSRDDIPQILKGLQHIYTNEKVKAEVFAVLSKAIMHKKTGRVGMNMWRVFVLSILRTNLDWDWDRLHYMANEHKTIRAILGHGPLDEDYEYPLQTIKDNVKLLTPEILIHINEIVVKEGHKIIKKKVQSLMRVSIVLL
jgi:hypothetical protein